MSNVSNYSTLPPYAWLFGPVSGAVCLFASAKALRIAKIIYPIFVQMRQAIGTPRYSALQMQWNAVSQARFRGTVYAITALASGAIACVIFFRCIKVLMQSRQQQPESPKLQKREYVRYI